MGERVGHRGSGGRYYNERDFVKSELYGNLFINRVNVNKSMRQISALIKV